MKERRKFIRYRAPSNQCQVFLHKSDIPWRLKDISKSGLAFEHHPELGVMADLTKIDILANCPNRFFISGVFCKTVYDIREIAESWTFTGIEIRRCGLQYKSLQKRHEDNLELLLNFLKQHF